MVAMEFKEKQQQPRFTWNLLNLSRALQPTPEQQGAKSHV